MVYNYVLSGWGKVGNVTGGTGGTTHFFSDIETMRLFCLANPSDSMILIYTGADHTYSVNQNYAWSTEGNPITNKTIYASTGQKISNGQWEFSGATNLIVRNFRRAISFNDLFQWRYATRIWIDHCEFDGEATSADNYKRGTTVDGCCDITKESDLITVSNCIFINAGDKTMLVGASDIDTADRGKLRVTLDRCLFFNSNGRTPFVRFSPLFHKINILHDWSVLPTFFSTCHMVGFEARILTTKCYFKRSRYIIREYDAGGSISGVKDDGSTIGQLSASSNISTAYVDLEVRSTNVNFDFATEPTYTWNALNTIEELEQWIAEWAGAKYHLITEEPAPTPILTVTRTPLAGGTISTTGGTITAGTSVTVIATPATGYTFSKWTPASDSNNVLSANQSYTFAMPASNLSIQAHFLAIPDPEEPIPPGQQKKIRIRFRNNLT